jgi:hypothetical protein
LRNNSAQGSLTGEQGQSPNPDMNVKQASLLGAYHDTDREEDDPLLDLGNAIENRNSRPSSEHYISSVRAINGLERRKESFRKSNSEHVGKTSITQPLNRSRQGINDAKGFALLPSNLCAKPIPDMEKYYSTSISASIPDIDKELPTISCDDTGNRNVNDNSHPVKTMDVKKNNKYFDKATMTWREREEHTKKEVYFDKVEFRWVVKKVKVEVEVKAKVSYSMDAPQDPTKVQAQNPFFLDMRKSKALQISKTERHSDVTKQGRSTIQGTSVSTKRQRRASVNMDQIKTAISSRNLLACIVCKTNKRTVLLVPCSHLCLCENCSKIQDHIENCPLCACRVSGKMIIA